MFGMRSWVRTHFWGLIVGTIVTAMTLVLFVQGVFDPLSFWLLNKKFRHFNQIEADESIVMIDVNDYALERVSSWPWPRELHSQLIQTLASLGARAVLMDIVFSEPKGGRLDDPQLDPDYRVDPHEVIGNLDQNNIVFDDEVFAEALQRAGNVYLATFARLYDPQFSPDALRKAAFSVLDENPGIGFSAFDLRLQHALTRFVAAAGGSGRQAARVEPIDVFQGLRIEHLLESSFQLDADEVAKRLGMPGAFVERQFAMAKRSVSRRLVRRFRREHPEATFSDVFLHFMPGVGRDVYSSDRDDLRRAYRAISSERAAIDHAPKVHPSLVGRIPHADDFTLPVDLFCEVSHVGLVSFETSPVDGVMRRVPLIVNVDGRLVKHLGFSLVSDVFHIDDDSIQVDEDGHLLMATKSGDRRWRIPLDADGRILINWHIDTDDPVWTKSFEHIPVAQLMAIPMLQGAIHDEQAVYHTRMNEYVKARAAGADSVLAEYQAMVREMGPLRERALKYTDLSDGERARLDELEAKTRELGRDSIDYVHREVVPQIREIQNSDQPLSPEVAEEREMLMILALVESGGKDTYGDRMLAAVDAKRSRIDELKGALKPRIAGKICLVGYTAAAVADTVNSPVFDEMPGVLAHANVINSILTGRFPRVEAEWVHVTMIILLGLVITVVTAWRDAWVSLLSVFMVIGALLCVSLAAFYLWAVHIKVEGCMIGVFVCWAMVTLYRQLTEERQKRAFSKSLAQYTSPAIADQLAESLSRRTGQLDLLPVPREVTCFFSDLKGFTSISERLGAARTRDLLNPYLEAMSGVLIDHNAMINKFMGDGIFAFFNPPILPAAEHAVNACESALDSFVALERLKSEMATGELEEEVRALSMRIGLNSGEVFVGDYGSGNKLDYTCIGDTVNLAARLEPACKVFGIQCLVSETTLGATGDRYLARHLGGLQVVGKKAAVQVYELIARREEANGDVESYARLFGQAVNRFQERDWGGAEQALEECRSRRPGDKAIAVILENVRQCLASPPPAEWNRAIELTSK